MRTIITTLLAFAAGAMLADDNANLIQNGTFDPDQPGWRPNADVTLEKDGEHGGMIVLRCTPDKDVKNEQEVKRDPSWSKLKISYWANVPAMKPGTAGFHHARFTVTMLGPNYFKKDRAPDEDKQAWHLVAGNWTEPTDGWVKVEQELEIPEPVITLRIGPGIFRAEGEMRVADLRVEAVVADGEK